MATNKKKFEEKMNDLENIINELENGNIDLEDSIKKYTEAMKIVKDCDEQLNIDVIVELMILLSVLGYKFQWIYYHEEVEMDAKY